jgi:hypothetical protein
MGLEEKITEELLGWEVNEAREELIKLGLGIAKFNWLISTISDKLSRPELAKKTSSNILCVIRNTRNPKVVQGLIDLLLQHKGNTKIIEEVGRKMRLFSDAYEGLTYDLINMLSDYKDKPEIVDALAETVANYETRINIRESASKYINNGEHNGLRIQHTSGKHASIIKNLIGVYNLNDSNSLLQKLEEDTAKKVIEDIEAMTGSLDSYSEVCSIITDALVKYQNDPTVVRKLSRMFAKVALNTKNKDVTSKLRRMLEHYNNSELIEIFAENINGIATLGSSIDNLGYDVFKNKTVDLGKVVDLALEYSLKGHELRTINIMTRSIKYTQESNGIQTAEQVMDFYKSAEFESLFKEHGDKIFKWCNTVGDTRSAKTLTKFIDVLKDYKGMPKLISGIMDEGIDNTLHLEGITEKLIDLVSNYKHDPEIAVLNPGITATVSKVIGNAAMMSIIFSKTPENPESNGIPEILLDVYRSDKFKRLITDFHKDVAEQIIFAVGQTILDRKDDKANDVIMDYFGSTEFKEFVYKFGPAEVGWTGKVAGGTASLDAIKTYMNLHSSFGNRFEHFVYEEMAQWLIENNYKMMTARLERILGREKEFLLNQGSETAAPLMAIFCELSHEESQKLKDNAYKHPLLIGQLANAWGIAHKNTNSQGKNYLNDFYQGLKGVLEDHPDKVYEWAGMIVESVKDEDSNLSKTIASTNGGCGS